MGKMVSHHEFATAAQGKKISRDYRPHSFKVATAEERQEFDALAAHERDILKTSHTNEALYKRTIRDPRVEALAEQYVTLERLANTAMGAMFDKYPTTPHTDPHSYPNLHLKDEDGYIVKNGNANLTGAEETYINCTSNLALHAREALDTMLASVAAEKRVTDPALYFAIEHEFRRDLDKLAYGQQPQRQANAGRAFRLPG